MTPEDILFHALWKASSGHPKGWRVTRQNFHEGADRKLHEACGPSGILSLFKSFESADRRAKMLNAEDQRTGMLATFCYVQATGSLSDEQLDRLLKANSRVLHGHYNLKPRQVIRAADKRRRAGGLHTPEAGPRVQACDGYGEEAHRRPQGSEGV